MGLQRMWGLLLASMAPILWGGMYPFSRVLMQTANPFALGESRLILAEVLYMVMNFLAKDRRKITRKDMVLMILLGAMGYGGTAGFQLYGTYLTSAHFAALVLSLTPLLLLLSMRLLLRVAVSKAAVWMSALSMIGLVVSIRPWSTIHGVHFFGVLVLLFSGVCWVLYSTYVQGFIAKYNSWAVMEYSTIGGIVVLLPLSWSKFSTIVPSLHSLLGIVLLVYVGILSTGVAYSCWNLSIKVVGPELPALFYFFQPLVATIIGVMALHEQLTVAFLVGAVEMIVCVTLGVYFQGRYKSTKKGPQLAARAEPSIAETGTVDA